MLCRGSQPCGTATGASRFIAQPYSTYAPILQRPRYHRPRVRGHRAPAANAGPAHPPAAAHGHFPSRSSSEGPPLRAVKLADELEDLCFDEEMEFTPGVRFHGTILAVITPEST